MAPGFPLKHVGEEHPLLKPSCVTGAAAEEGDAPWRCRSVAGKLRGRVPTVCSAAPLLGHHHRKKKTKPNRGELETFMSRFKAGKLTHHGLERFCGTRWRENQIYVTRASGAPRSLPRTLGRSGSACAGSSGTTVPPLPSHRTMSCWGLPQHQQPTRAGSVLICNTLA